MAAKKRKKSSKKSMKGKCKIVTVCGKRRKLCYGSKGIKSNSPASGGGSRKKRKSTKRKGGGTKLKTAAGNCRFGKAKTGKRKGQCLKNKRPKK